METKITTILLTGPPGVGKTTLVRKICQELQQVGKVKCRGFYTEEVRDGNGGRIGFDVVTLQGTRGILARVQPADALRRLKIGKYTVYVNDFERLTLPLLQTDEAGLLVIDEIGKMELISKKFETLVNDRAVHVPLLATVPYQTRQPIPLVERLKHAPNTKLFVISKTNRNQIQTEILQCIEVALNVK